jgi:pimeloyl-ACP methyl ester carboxylesterase
MLCWRPVRLLTVFLLLCAALLAPARAAIEKAPPPRPPALPAWPFISCSLSDPQGVVAIAAECGEVEVPEDYALATGRHLKLFVARVPALSRNKQADPLVILAGGPGLGASVFYPGIAANLARIRRDRDILVIDQRGTGRSNPLNCAFDEQKMWEADEGETTRVMAACLAQLSAHNDVSRFTTSVAIRDLESVRRALGYAHFNFYASSYGTRVAQHFARRYPGQTRALILDGVIPPTLVLGPDTPLDAQAALDRTFARCTEDAACRARFGDPREDYDALRAKLAEQPVHLNLPNPRTGEPDEVDFGADAFAGALRLAGYSADRAALLPLMLQMANREQRFAPLAAQFVMTAGSYDEVIAYGMHNSVVCSEDVPLYDDAKLDRERIAKTFLGTAQVDSLRALCKGWPRGPIDEDLHAPLESLAPALLLSGTADPVTPAAYGDEAAKGFAYAVHVKVQDAGHGQVVQPCVDRVMATFLDLAEAPETVKTLDTKCLTDIKPPPFFLSLSGPGP